MKLSGCDNVVTIGRSEISSWGRPGVVDRYCFLLPYPLVDRTVGEMRGELHRIVSIIKMRDSARDNSIRQYTIKDQGIRVLDKLERAEGVLTGIARLASQERGKRGTR